MLTEKQELLMNALLNAARRKSKVILKYCLDDLKTRNDLDICMLILENAAINND